MIISLPVYTELDGLSTNVTQLGQAAHAAMQCVSSHIHSHILLLEAQMSKGNYLTSPSVPPKRLISRIDSSNTEQNMDDLILRSAI